MPYRNKTTGKIVPRRIVWKGRKDALKLGRLLRLYKSGRISDFEKPKLAKVIQRLLRLGQHRYGIDPNAKPMTAEEKAAQERDWFEHKRSMQRFETSLNHVRKMMKSMDEKLQKAVR